MGASETLSITKTKLKRIALLSEQDPRRSFESLMHHFNEESLKECFYELDGKKALGADGIDKETYGKDLDQNIPNLITRMKNMSYRPGPVREVLIPKEGRSGAIRPLGISGFEDKIVQKMMQQILMFKAGVLSEGDLRKSDEGVPQGSICSPVLANIFAHYVIDMWIEEMVKPNCKGKVRLFRYADDAIISCQYDGDAKRIRKALVKRLGKYKLELNEEKTKQIPFDKRLVAQGIEQGTFDFLGFTFYWGKAKSGRIIPKLKTKAKTMRAKLNKVKEWIKGEKDRKPLSQIWKTFVAKLRGHINYYGVSYNSENVSKFVYEAKRIVFKWLNRCSQRKSFTWEKFAKYIESHLLPTVKIVHRLF